MPYKRKSELPASVRDNLPGRAQDIYRKAFNSAWETYDDPKQRRGDTSQEQTAHRVAWAAVKKEFEQDEDSGEWKPKAGNKS